MKMYKFTMTKDYQPNGTDAGVTIKATGDEFELGPACSITDPDCESCQ